MMTIEVCYASQGQQWLLSVVLPEGSTVIQAIMLSGMLDKFPEVNIINNVGIFSKKVPLNHVLNKGDRVEIYRPLSRTPNQLRLLRGN